MPYTPENLTPSLEDRNKKGSAKAEPFLTFGWKTGFESQKCAFFRITFPGTLEKLQTLEKFGFFGARDPRIQF